MLSLCYINHDVMQTWRL